MAIVHTKHDGHNSRLVGDDVALKADLQRAASASGHGVASPTRMHKPYLEPWKTREDIGFGEARVDAALGDAVAVENNRVAVLQQKTLLRRKESGDAG